MTEINTVAEVATEETVVKEKPYKLRNLEGQDMFVMFRIISAIGIDNFKVLFEGKGVVDVFKKLLQGAGKEDVLNNSEELVSVGASVVFDFLQIIITNISKCEREVYQLLSNLSGMKVEKIKTLGMVTFTEMVLDVLQKGEFRDFIQVVSVRFK